jgi:hypothetical protein
VNSHCFETATTNFLHHLARVVHKDSITRWPRFYLRVADVYRCKPGRRGNVPCIADVMPLTFTWVANFAYLNIRHFRRLQLRKVVHLASWVLVCKLPKILANNVPYSGVSGGYRT